MEGITALSSPRRRWPKLKVQWRLKPVGKTMCPHRWLQTLQKLQCTRAVALGVPSRFDAQST